MRDAAGNESCVAAGFVLSETTDGGLCGGLQPTIVGTAGPDDIVGTSAADVIAGLGGDDIITSSGGDDVVCGGDGADLLIGGKGNDTLLGQDGDDDLNGGDWADTMEGGDGADVLIGGKEGDGLSGGLGDDTSNGGSGDDTLDGGPGVDDLNGGRGTDPRTTGETVAVCEHPSRSRTLRPGLHPRRCPVEGVWRGALPHMAPRTERPHGDIALRWPAGTALQTHACVIRPGGAGAFGTCRSALFGVAIVTARDHEIEMPFGATAATC